VAATGFGSLVFKTSIVHTVSYFVVGILAAALLDYEKVFAGPVLGSYMRPLSDPWVMAGPLFQPLRGIVFASALYPLREILFQTKRGWLSLWWLLVALGVLSTFGPAPSSIDGVIYTKLTFKDHLLGLPEILLQSFLLAGGLFYWVNNPQKRWFGRTLYALFAIEALLLTLGLLTRK